MLRVIAILFGIAFIIAGVAGFIPEISLDGKLLGYFTINPICNVIYIITGIVAIMSSACYCTTRLYFQLIGLIYSSAAIWGLWKGGDLYLFQAQMNDSLLYMAIGVMALLLGFSPRRNEK